jgi:membrane carboxypeptidase/penicillin-binding protein
MAPKLTKKYAIKSGSTDNDLWAIGYNKDIVTAVWTGYDDNKVLSTDDKIYSKYIWADAVESYLREKENNWYEKPDNVVGVLVNPITGKAVTTKDERKKILYYIKGTEPSNTDSTLDNLIKSDQ